MTTLAEIKAQHDLDSKYYATIGFPEGYQFRCQLRAPGRSAGECGPFNWKPGAVMPVGRIWMIQGEGEVYFSRANAAAAAWKQREYLKWKDVNAELERVWETMPEPRFLSRNYREWINCF